MHKVKYIVLILASYLFANLTYAQNNQIKMQVLLDTESNSVKIQQQITYYNKSSDTLNSIFLHDWANAFSSKNSMLGKRFVENYSKKFFFTKDKNRGFTKINNITVNYQTTAWKRSNETADYIEIPFEKLLIPSDSITINLNYLVKLPHTKFTGYGVNKGIFNLRYWHMTPAVYTDKWELLHHLDMDDLYQDPTDYTVKIMLPNTYQIASNLFVKKESENQYKLSGKGLMDFELHLSPSNDFEQFQTEKVLVSTNLNTIQIESNVKLDILNRQLLFLTENLGGYPHEKIFVNNTTYTKNPLYGFNQLPKILRPFSDTFEWDMRMFKTLTNYYIKNSLFTHTRENTWLQNGIQSYMMSLYVKENYPEIKLMGGISKIWGIRSYYISELEFNNRQLLTYRYAARRSSDQTISMRTDSLTNFNRKILSKYKSGMGLLYLDDYLGDNIVPEGVKQYFTNNTLKKDSTDIFKKFISSETNKNLTWFFNDYIKTDKKVDYTITKTSLEGDSIQITIKNKKSFSPPISLYSLNNNVVLSKKWLIGIDSTKTITLPKGTSKNWMLNYEKIIPEVNLKDNWGNTTWSLIKRPLKIRWLTDAEDPYHKQLFIEPSFNYNLYDGLILSTSITNKSLVKKEFEYKVSPSYGMTSKSLTGFFKGIYWKYPESKKIESYRFGLVGSYFHYQPNLAYKKITPYAQIFFKRKNLRSVKGSSISTNFTMVDREKDPLNDTQPEPNQYNIFSLNYAYSNPEIINNFLFLSTLEIGTNFSKLSADIRFRKLTNSNRLFGARLFVGVFLHNKTDSNFFSYGINRPNDYLFRYQYYGRSETSGIFSQQFIMNDGGFKSQMPVGFANQWITSFNTSIGLWRWFEIYNDVGLAKNMDQPVYFIHDKGVRLNFVNNILEVYFPLHSNNGWEVSQPHYEERIRFVLTSNFKSIIHFLKRGFM